MIQTQENFIILFIYAKAHFVVYDTHITLLNSIIIYIHTDEDQHSDDGTLQITPASPMCPQLLAATPALLGQLLSSVSPPVHL